MPTTDTTVNNLIINKLTKAQYVEIQNPSETELYLVPDEVDTAPTSGSSNCITSGGVYTALSNKIDKSSTAGLIKNDGTVDTNTYLTTAPVTSVNGQTGAVSLTIPTVPTNVSAFTNDAGYLTSHQDISGKENKMIIVSPTISNNAFTVSVGNYYVLSSAVSTLTIHLPYISSATVIEGLMVYLTTDSSTPDISFDATDGNNSNTIMTAGEFEASTTYEINCIFNGVAWVITSTPFENS